MDGPRAVVPLSRRALSARGAAAAVTVALFVEAAATWRVVEKNLPTPDHDGALLLALAAFALAAGAVRRLPVHQAERAVAAGSLLLVAVALHRPPNSSRDWVRYAWDGKVQLHGIDPYRYPPDSPALAALRDGFLRPFAACAVAQPRDRCFRVDRAGVHTIYPPVAQALFALVELLTGRRAESMPFQVLGAVAVLGVTAILLRRRSPGAALWAWCPLVIVQYVNDAHIDAVATAFAVLGLTAGSRPAGRAGPPPRYRTRRALAAGAWVGAGIATKVLPVLLLPALVGGLRPLRTARARWPGYAVRGAAVAVAATGVVAVGYLPHLLAVRGGVFGYLPGYLHEEGYADGERFHLLAWFVTGPDATRVAAVVLLVVALVAAARAEAAAPERSALLMVGAFLLVTTPTYPWYGGLLVAMAALADRPRWIVLALAAIPTYGAAALGSSIDVAGRESYTVAALVVLGIPAGRLIVGAVRRRRPRPVDTPPNPGSGVLSAAWPVREGETRRSR